MNLPALARRLPRLARRQSRTVFGGNPDRRRLHLAALFALLLMAAALPVPAQEGQAQQLESRVFEIASLLRCPVCVSESVAESSSPTSLQMRSLIQEQLEQGRSDAQILAFFQERYGDWILLEPPKRGIHLFVWLLPPLVAIIGLTALVLLIRRWTRASREPVEADESDLRRVRQALKNRN